MHHCGAAAHGVEGEAAGVAEHIEHTSAAGIALEERAVVALIHKEAGLLALEPVGVKAQTILHGLGGAESAYDIVVLGVKARLEGQRGLGLVVHVFDAGAGEVNEGLRYDSAGKVHAGRVSLDHGGGAIHIDHEAGEEVALAVHQSVCIIVGAHQAECLSQRESLAEARAVEFIVNDAFAEYQHSHGYGANLEVAGAYDAAVSGGHLHQVALLHIVGHRRQRAREYPGVVAVKRFFFAFAQI